MMSSNSSTVPPQYAAPAAFTPDQLAALPHNNSGPKLDAVIWALTGLASMFLGLRLYCKLSRHKRLWWDDYILIASWVLHAVSPTRGIDTDHVRSVLSWNAQYSLS